MDRTDRNQEIGSGVQRYRIDAGLSQKALSDAMRARGWKWSQPTVAAIEQGQRPLKVDELPDLADILGLPSVDRFFVASPEEIGTRRLEQAEEAVTALRRAAIEYLRAQFSLAIALDEIEAGHLTPPTSSEHYETLLNSTPAQIAGGVRWDRETPADLLAKSGLQFKDPDGNWHDFGVYDNNAVRLKQIIAANPEQHGTRLQPNLSPQMWREPPNGEHHPST